MIPILTKFRRMYGKLEPEEDKDENLLPLSTTRVHENNSTFKDVSKYWLLRARRNLKLMVHANKII